MTLIIYLDTQDYIKLFNEPANGPNHQILADLLAFRDRGEIVIGYSFANIVEFITKPDAANRGERVRRGQLIKDICARNAFPYPGALPERITFPNNGTWMLGSGEKVMSARQFRKQMHETLLEELAKKEGLNRKQRRQLGRKASMTDLVRRTGSTWGRKRSDWGNFPVSDELIQSRIVERFMKGECSDREFEERMNAWFSDPAEYSRIVYDYADQPNIIAKYFGDSTDKIERVMETIQDAVSIVQELNEQMLIVRADLVEAGIAKSEARDMTRQFSIPKTDLDTIGPKLEVELGTGRSGHFQHYFERVLKPGHVFKRSDVMDMFQMCYAYDCDLFRCDKAMANTFRNFEPFQGKLVARFADLPKRIDALLGADTEFTAHAATLRRRLHSSVDSTDAIRADRARGGAA